MKTMINLIVQTKSSKSVCRGHDSLSLTAECIEEAHLQTNWSNCELQLSELDNFHFTAEWINNEARNALTFNIVSRKAFKLSV